MFKKLLLLSFIVTTVPAYSVNQVTEDPAFQVVEKYLKAIDNMSDNLAVLVTELQTNSKMHKILDDLENCLDIFISLSPKERKHVATFVRKNPQFFQDKIEKIIQKWIYFIGQPNSIGNRVKEIFEKSNLITVGDLK